MIALGAAVAALLVYVGVVVGYRWYRHGGPPIVVEDRIVVEEDDERTPLLERFAAWCADRFAGDVLRRLGTARLNAIRQQLDRAGHPNGMTLESYIGRKIAYSLIFLVLAAVFVGQGMVVLGLLLLAFGYFITDLDLRLRQRRRQDDIERDLPDFLDILAVSVRAGLSFRSAIDRVADAVPGPLADEMLVALRKMDLGESRRASMQELRDRNDSDMLGRFVASLLQAQQLGTPLAQTMQQIAAEMRLESAARARERASRAAPRVSLVVTLVILPAAMMVMVAGLLITTDFNLSLFDA